MKSSARMQIVSHMNTNSGNQEDLEKTINVKINHNLESRKASVAEQERAMRMNVPLMPLVEGS